MAPTIRLNNADEWTVSSPNVHAARRGAAAAASAAPIEPEFLAPGVSVAQVSNMVPTAAPPAAGIPMIDLSVTPEGDETYVLAVRHTSGAITFHGPDVPAAASASARRGRGGKLPYRFRVPLRSVRSTDERRGVATVAVAGVVTTILLKVTSKIVDMFLPALAAKAEAALWQKAGLAEGWFKLDAATLRSGQLTPGKPGGPGPSGRALLFVHGTFSHAASAFKNLADSDFFANVKGLYGDQIYAFNHFTVSKTPEQNARELLDGLPEAGLTFDVVTHSRGGLVLRNLVERSAVLGAAAARFRLNHGVLVASPNAGTPLATPARWDNTVGWFANLLEMFPDNPLTFAAGFVADAIVWIAHSAIGGLPGLAAMDAASDSLRDLQQPSAAVAQRYSALVANFLPSENILERLLDVGVDAFFGSANDLVVPSEGGWEVDPTLPSPAIPGDRIGCFGPGGNLPPDLTVHHLNFFTQQQSADFIVRALSGKPQGLAPVDPASALPTQHLLRRGDQPALAAAAAAARQAAPRPQAPSAAAAAAASEPASAELSPVFSDALQLTLIAPRMDDGAAKPSRKAAKISANTPDKQSATVDELRPYQLLATYGGARVLEPFTAGGGEAGKRWYKIIEFHERMKKYVDGMLGFDTPTDDELIEYGTLLFETLFPREVRRLYDVARSRERSGHLNVIFTSMVPWIADKPWEFAFDPDQKTFLATQDLHFVRNALTARPAEVIEPKKGPLRILVAVAQPIGTVQLSSEEETTVIRRAFQPLVETGLAQIEVLRSTTPTVLHRWLSRNAYDVVHFIGHGTFDHDAQKGYLIFEDDKGSLLPVDTRTACEIFCRRNIQLLFLNACETGRGDRAGTPSRKADFNRGVAPGLVAAGLPAVVANQFSVRDQAATDFSQHFYWALAQGSTLGAAAREARIAVNYSTSHDIIDWAVPVVYARDPESRLCKQRELTLDMVMTPPQVAPSARRATQAHKFRVALWDINHMFPELEAAAVRMNAAQDRFGFEVVEISAPVGTWQYYRKEGLQLNADVAARGLKNKRQELGVDFLFCITDKPIMYRDADGPHWNYYCWWSDPGEENIIIYSAMAGVPQRGAGANHAIANGLVQGLTGILADTGTHERGSKQCPLYWNQELALDLVVNRQKFDANCRKKLKKEIPDDLPALESILDAFG